MVEERARASRWRRATRPPTGRPGRCPSPGCATPPSTSRCWSSCATRSTTSSTSRASWTGPSEEFAAIVAAPPARAPRRPVAAHLRHAPGPQPPPAGRRPRAVAGPRRARPRPRHRARPGAARRRDRRGRPGRPADIERAAAAAGRSRSAASARPPARLVGAPSTAARPAGRARCRPPAASTRGARRRTGGPTETRPRRPGWPRARRRARRLADEHDLPVENLLAPDTVRRLCLGPAGAISVEAVTEVLARGDGARAWQVEPGRRPAHRRSAGPTPDRRPAPRARPRDRRWRPAGCAARLRERGDRSTLEPHARLAARGHAARHPARPRGALRSGWLVLKDGRRHRRGAVKGGKPDQGDVETRAGWPDRNAVAASGRSWYAALSTWLLHQPRRRRRDRRRPDASTPRRVAGVGAVGDFGQHEKTDAQNYRRFAESIGPREMRVRSELPVPATSSGQRAPAMPHAARTPPPHRLHGSGGGAGQSPERRGSRPDAAVERLGRRRVWLPPAATVLTRHSPGLVRWLPQVRSRLLTGPSEGAPVPTSTRGSRHRRNKRQSSGTTRSAPEGAPARSSATSSSSTASVPRSARPARRASTPRPAPTTWSSSASAS